tara:strand:+ start:2914 stop:3162 length:249 start_codon:yes stop_codon:yes gene_type:complete
MLIRPGIIIKLVQLGALPRTWRERVFKPGGGKKARWKIELTDDDIVEVRKALEHIRFETKHTLEHNQKMYANSIYGGRLFPE